MVNGDTGRQQGNGDLDTLRPLPPITAPLSQRSRVPSPPEREARPSSAGGPPSVGRPPSGGRPPSEARPSPEARPFPEARPPSEARPASDTRPPSDARPLPEVRPPYEARPAQAGTSSNTRPSPRGAAPARRPRGAHSAVYQSGYVSTYDSKHPGTDVNAYDNLYRSSYDNGYRSTGDQRAGGRTVEVSVPAIRGVIFLLGTVVISVVLSVIATITLIAVMNAGVILPQYSRYNQGTNNAPARVPRAHAARPARVSPTSPVSALGICVGRTGRIWTPVHAGRCAHGKFVHVQPVPSPP